jgi:flavin reductase (DIM6/NTAB) family NADH-FMN oxidoreductase RutF
MSEFPFHEIAPEALTDNVFKAIGKQWMMITAGTAESFNPMTASWGGLGILWSKPVAFVVVRPQRFTFGLMEAGTHYSLTFFDETYRKALNYCGTRSGRDVDKVAETSLTPLPGKTGAILFEEARLAIECRKLYAQDLTEANFVDTTIVDQAYPARDFHRMYVGEVVRIWGKG